MLRYLYADQLEHYPDLADQMFRDRADQFRTRLNWEVSVDARGHERDTYDDLNPLYVIWTGPSGQHQGSMRFLPTTGPTMVNDHFSHLNGDLAIQSPLIWECTRFCLGRDAGKTVAAGLMLGGGELMRAFNVEHFVGVFDQRMIRIYKAIGASPEVLGGHGTGRDRISVGLWSFGLADRRRVLARAGVSSALSEHWFTRAFGRPPSAAHTSIAA